MARRGVLAELQRQGRRQPARRSGAHEPVVGFGDRQMDAGVAQRGEAEAEAVEAVDQSGSEPIQLDPVVDVAVGVGGWHG
jgi:hypothetical protein